MEDAHISKPDLSAVPEAKECGPLPQASALFAVFDGHGGKEVAKFCQDHFVAEMLKSPLFKRGDYIGALKETFHTMDQLLDDEVTDSLFLLHLPS
jgi:serine/threonine protein phosphatase PrpC